MRIYSLIALLVVPLALRSCQPQNLPTVGDLVRGREVVTDSSKVVQKNGGYQGILIIGDDPDSDHGQMMKSIITRSPYYRADGSVYWPRKGISIPEKNLTFFAEFAGIEPGVDGENVGLRLFTSKEHESLRLSTRVVHLPLFVPFSATNDIARIAKNNILFVTGTGNTYLANDDRDMWNTGHLLWQGVWHGVPRVLTYNNILAIFKTGKYIAATSAIETEEGDIVPLEMVIKCGDIAEWCFYGVARVIYFWSICSSRSNGFLPGTALSHSRRDSRDNECLCDRYRVSQG